MAKVVYVPLDERPCNYQYPKALANMTDLEIVLPNRNILGDMKVSAKVEQLLEWLEGETLDADYLVVSIDMLIYGGIVPSRLHDLTLDECLERIGVLGKIKKENPSIRIFAFDLIMRTPSSNTSEEEPEYYEIHGENIFQLGRLRDMSEQGVLDDLGQQMLISIEANLPSKVKADYLGRRDRNFTVTKNVLSLVEKESIDYLIILLDDNSEYGFTAREQRELMYMIDNKNLMDKVNIYPGADEIGCTLFARVFCEVKEYLPEVFLRYSSTNGPFIIPRYEDRSLSESIKSHITSAGGVIVNDENHNDYILMVHSPSVGEPGMAESSFPLETRHRSYFSEVNIREFIQSIKHYTNKGRNVALADVAICNGGDHSLMKVLSKGKLMGELMAYAGWNTSGNTLGTVIAHAIIMSYYKRNPNYQSTIKEKNSRAFYYSRLVEDWGYQSIVRKHVSYDILPTLGLLPRDLGDQVNKVTSLVDQLLTSFVDEYLADIPEGNIQLSNINLPWKRMFEVGFEIKLLDKNLAPQGSI